ncbi:MAG: toll/interleukin-1 receptor domain-containing protein [Candidatus Cryptobacteroides sp.]
MPSMDARSFMSFIVNTLTSTDESSPFRQQVIGKRRRQGIFISYYHDDEVIATKLFFMLSRKFPNVWFDMQRLKVGDYNAEIASAIAESKVFIPVLSPAVANHLKDGDDSHYYRTEWAMASQMTGPDAIDEDKGTYILPLAVNGYDLFDNECHRDKFEVFTGCHNTGVDLMSPSGFSQLVERIDRVLNK